MDRQVRTFTPAQTIVSRRQFKEKQWELKEKQARNELEAMAVYAKKLVAFMADAYAVSHKMYPTVTRNKKNSEMRAYPDGKYQIVFGWACLKEVYKDGFYEYKSIRSKVTDGHVEHTGRKGIWRLALHEFAHVTQTEEDRFARTHGALFCEKLNELTALFPFEEVEKV
jgi:hypothetical protein